MGPCKHIQQALKHVCTHESKLSRGKRVPASSCASAEHLLSVPAHACSLTSMSRDEFHPFSEQPKNGCRFVATASLGSELLWRLVAEARDCSSPRVCALEMLPLESQPPCYAVKHQESWRSHEDKGPGAQ